MYLEKVKAKGKTYLYLKKYNVKKMTVYRFGRIEKARENMEVWKEDINTMPKELKELGCTRDDIHRWIQKSHPITKQS